MRGSEMVSFALWYDSFLVDSWGICQQQCRVLELIWLEWFDLCSVQCDRVILCFFMFFPKWQNMVVQRLHACHLAEFAAGVLCKSRNSRHGSLPYLTGCRNRRTCWTCTILNKYIYICVWIMYIYIYISIIVDYIGRFGMITAAYFKLSGCLCVVKDISSSCAQTLPSRRFSGRAKGSVEKISTSCSRCWSNDQELAMVDPLKNMSTILVAVQLALIPCPIWNATARS